MTGRGFVIGCAASFWLKNKLFPMPSGWLVAAPGAG
ncbi:hypothetical protein BH160DRAFT_3599 [Burkholderia sp. H160]|nr:hypothetical protein BH160DRAFT_3599 [Burkholderia sp. H160]